MNKEVEEAYKNIKEDIEIYKQKGVWKEKSIFVKSLRLLLNYIKELEKHQLRFMKEGLYVVTKIETDNTLTTSCSQMEDIDTFLKKYIPRQKILNIIKEKQNRINQLHPVSDCVIIDDLENQIEVCEELLK